MPGAGTIAGIGLVGAVLLVGCGPAPSASGPVGPGAVSTTSAGDRVFDDSRVHTVTIEMSAPDWAEIEETADAYENVNADFPYYAAILSFDGDELAGEVGVRLKGHISIPLSHGHSYPLKVDLNRYAEGQELDGLSKLNLNTNFDGPVLPIARDFISYDAWRRFDVASARTAFATVTVNGEELGTYVMVEQVDGGFIERNFDGPYGQLYKPEQFTGTLEYRGPDIEAYDDINHKWPDEPDHAPLLHALAILDSGSVDEVEAVFDVEGVLTYLAGNVALASWDSYAATGHNYYLYELAPGRFTLLPWDMNGSLEPAGDLLCAAHGALLSGRLLSDLDNEARYFEILEQFLGTAGSDAELIERMQRAQDLVGDDFPSEHWQILAEQIDVRSDLVEEQLASTTSCHVERTPRSP
jgi:spore coat protein CotH